MHRRTLFTLVIVALVTLASPVALFAEDRVHDAHWTVNIHSRPDGTHSAVGTLHLGSVSGGDRQAWRIVGVEQLEGSSRLEFLKLLGTPVGPARVSTPVELDVRIDYGEAQTPDAAGRVKVQFTWSIDGEHTFAKDGTIQITGKQISIKNKSTFNKITGDEA
jgi:hypothetical protein